VGEVSYPYAGGGGVTDARYESLMAEISGNGRLAYAPSSTTMSQGLVYADSTGRQVKVRANQSAVVRGFKWETDGNGLIQPIDSNTSGMTRLDLGVLRLNRQDWTLSFRIRKGTPANTPVAPTPQQDIGLNGMFEWPVAKIRVTSSTTAGLPSIGAADVTRLDHFIAPAPRIGHSSQRPDPDWGTVYTEYDTGRTLIGMGSWWNLVGENDSRNRLTLGTNWGQPGNIWYRRRNGMVLLDGSAEMVGSSKAAGTDITICTIPAEARPSYDVPILGYLDAGNLCRVMLDASTGRLTVSNYGTTFQKGWYLSLNAAWSITN